MNGDGLDDLVIGAPGADPGDRADAGQTYVVFGKADGAPVEIADVLAGRGGFALDGIRAGDQAGSSVGGAGDVNGDGFADLILRAPLADGPDTPAESYVVFGGDLTASVDLLGSAGDDQLVGTAADEIVVGGRGDDVLIGGGGADVLNGAAGDDLLAIADLGFRKLLGGSGTDTVRLDGAGDLLDLTAISDLVVRDVERIDLNGDGSQLVLDTLEILNLDDNSNALTVFGDATNAVRGDLTGATPGQTTVDGLTFDSFTVGNAALLVQTAVDTSGVVV